MIAATVVTIVNPRGNSAVLLFFFAWYTSNLRWLAVLTDSCGQSLVEYDDTSDAVQQMRALSM
jgi:hypothetical protein